MNCQLLIIDPQNDFCTIQDGCGNKGSLVVPGADQDMARVATMIRRIGPKLNAIHVTLDSHHEVAIERPAWWKRLGDGAQPAPFTILGIHPDNKRIVKFNADASGLHPTEEEYTTYMPSFVHHGGPTGEGVFGYLRALAAAGRYPHVVWPVHCLIGEWGHNVVPELRSSLKEWCLSRHKTVSYVTKGSNPWTEHFSGVKAEVPDPADPTTQINTDLITVLEKADIIGLAGEALSHCVANSVRDIATYFHDPKYIAKLVLLTDATSNVGGFEFLGDAFMKEMLAKGMQISTTDKFLS